MSEIKIPVVIEGDAQVFQAQIERVLAQYGCLERCELSFLAGDAAKDQAQARVFRPAFRVGALLDHVKRALKEGDQGAVSLAFGGYVLDLAQGVLRVEGGAEIRLTDKECDLLRILHAAGGEMVERDALLAQIWGYAPDVETHTVETHIYRLRQKIESDSALPVLVLTDGAGYRLAGIVSP